MLGTLRVLKRGRIVIQFFFFSKLFNLINICGYTAHFFHSIF